MSRFLPTQRDMESEVIAMKRRLRKMEGQIQRRLGEEKRKKYVREISPLKQQIHQVQAEIGIMGEKNFMHKRFKKPAIDRQIYAVANKMDELYSEFVRTL